MKINLHNMDCMEAMPGMEDNQYDLAIVDPPYGIGEFWKKSRGSQYKRSHDWNQKIPDKEYFDQLFRVSKNQIIWGGNYFTEHLPATNSWIVWDKGTDVEKVFMSECELAWTSFNIPARIHFCEWSGARKGSETGIKTIHPCQRPVRLHKWLLEKYAKTGDRILDTHGGSMSIAIACHDMGFDLDLYEIDPEYYAAGVERFERHRAQLVLDFESVGG